MKNLIKLNLMLLVVMLTLTSCAPAAERAMKRNEKERYLYLVAGFDDAAENTDVLFTIGYDKATNIASIAQIPRDTFIDFGSSQNKINQYFASCVSRGESRDAAMKYTADFIASALGVTFDGYIGLDLSAFRSMVDTLGGVEISVPEDMVISLDGEEQLKLSRGVNTFDGAAAEKFVRYRKGYVMGDLGRIDAQKLFLSSLLHKLSLGLTFPTLMRIAGILQNEAVTDLRLASVASIVMDAVRNGATAEYITLPGEPVMSKNGLSFYVLNRKCAAEIAKRYMYAEETFDKERKFLKSDEIAFSNVYEDDGFVIREYRDDELADIHLGRRKE